MAYARPAVLLASALTLLGSLASCGTGGTAVDSSPRPSAPADRTAGGTERAVPSDSVAASVRSGSRCTTSELRASVGRMDPGAGQRNFPVVLTNGSSRTCTVYGYPGAAFVDASGGQLGPDPRRTPGDATVVTLAPGESAWAGLRYASPGVSGARTAVPAALLVTPPDEQDPLKVPWKGREVPVSGNASSVFISVLQPGTGP